MVVVVEVIAEVVAEIVCVSDVEVVVQVVSGSGLPAFFYLCVSNMSFFTQAISQ